MRWEAPLLVHRIDKRIQGVLCHVTSFCGLGYGSGTGVGVCSATDAIEETLGNPKF
jgi:hypothetical protein